MNAVPAGPSLWTRLRLRGPGKVAAGGAVVALVLIAAIYFVLRPWIKAKLAPAPLAAVRAVPAANVLAASQRFGLKPPTLRPLPAAVKLPASAVNAPAKAPNTSSPAPAAAEQSAPQKIRLMRMDVIKAACYSEISVLCPRQQTSAWKILRCLEDHEDSLTSECAKSLAPAQ